MTTTPNTPAMPREARRSPARGAGQGAAQFRIALRRAMAQGLFEARMILRNGEQLLITILFPVFLLIVLTRSTLIDIGDGTRVDIVVPGTIALAIATTAFTSQAIATSFDRRNGVLRLLATTPLGKGGLLAGKILGVLAVEAVQITILVIAGLALGWSPTLSGIPAAIGAALLGTLAFTALAMLLAGTVRAEGVLAIANLLLIALVVGGGLIIPPAQLPSALATIAHFLPSGALGEAMRGALGAGSIPPLSVVVLLAWSSAFGWGASKLFRWS